VISSPVDSRVPCGRSADLRLRVTRGAPPPCRRGLRPVVVSCLRWSEAIGLPRATSTSCGARCRPLHRQDAGGRVRITEATKSDASRRSMAMPPTLVKVLAIPGTELTEPSRPRDPADRRHRTVGDGGPPAGGTATASICRLWRCPCRRAFGRYVCVRHASALSGRRKGREVSRSGHGPSVLERRVLCLSRSGCVSAHDSSKAVAEGLGEPRCERGRPSVTECEGM
jgi:hypothetical protein